MKDVYHHRGGLFFDRNADGSVHILKRDGEDGPVLFEIVLDVDSWTRIVAHCSALKENPVAHRIAYVLHMGTPK